MNFSRRELTWLLPAIAAAQTSGQKDALHTTVLRHEDMEAKQSGTLLMRQAFTGDTHKGYRVDLHESELPAGQAPHAPHQHVHEELLLVREGSVDVTTGGKTTRLGPGSVAYFASNQEHGWRNTGKETARYFVLALGDDAA
jgi:quercetin dioxygenase-like cupin family protein